MVFPLFFGWYALVSFKMVDKGWAADAAGRTDIAWKYSILCVEIGVIYRVEQSGFL